VVEALIILLGLEITAVLAAAVLGLLGGVQHLLQVKEMLEVLAHLPALNMAVVVAEALARLEETVQEALEVLGA
jgi:ABC-type microcin C transport system permease subunit YejE